MQAATRSTNSRAPCRCLLDARRYVSADRKKAADEFFAKQDAVQDNRVHRMRELLFGSEKDPKLTRAAIDARRTDALAKAMPSREAHEAIDAAFSIVRTRRSDRRKADLASKYTALQHAIAELERLDGPDGRLFRAATDRPACEDAVPSVALEGREGADALLDGAAISASGRIPGLFPRQMRVPSETPGRVDYDEGWTRPKPA